MNNTTYRAANAQIGAQNLKALGERKRAWAINVLRPIRHYRNKGWTRAAIAELLKIVGVERFRGGTEWTSQNVADLLCRYGKAH
jgi:hypothetical protein